jgi:hypothetical protein
MAPPWVSQLSFPNPPMIAANNASSPMNIAGRTFSVHKQAGGLHLRIALPDGTASDFARDLAKLGGVRVVRRPESVGRGTCFLAHCPGFKLVLSTDEAGGPMLALVSRAPVEVGSEKPSQLSDLLTVLMREQLSRPTGTSSSRNGFAFGKEARSSQNKGAVPLRPKAFSAAGFSGKKKPSLSAEGQPLGQTALRPGKPLARRTPLSRKTPLRRGRISRL